MSGNPSDARRSLVIGSFNRFDAGTITALLRLARRGPLHILVLGDGFPTPEEPLMTGGERVEIVQYVRGVAETTLVLDREHLRSLVEREGPATEVWWLVAPTSLGMDDLMTAGHHSVDSLVGAVR